MSGISNLDLLIIVLYLIVVIVVALYLSRRDAKKLDNNSSENYFLAGRNLTWFGVGLSLIASNFSSTTLIGLSGAAYNTGISIAAYEWMATIILVIFAIYFVPYYLSSRVYTMPEFLEKRFDSKCRYYFSGMTIIGNMFIDTAGTLFAGALIINFFFPSVDFWQSAALLALFAGIYTAVGGLSAVVYTDIIQVIVLVIGSILTAFLVFNSVESWSYVRESVSSDMLSSVRPLSDQTMPWPGLVIGVPILGFYFWCTNQFIVQRVLAARDISHARWGVLLAAFLKIPTMILLIYPGVIAKVLFPNLETPDLVFPTLISELLPIGVKGIVLAGLIAAIMSSIDSTLHSASTLVTMDFVKKARPDLKQATLAKVGKVVTLIFMVISILWIPVVASFETLFHYLQNALAFFVPPVVAIFLMGLLWKRASAKGAFYGLLLGHAFSVIFLYLRSTDFFPNIHFLIVGGIIFAFSLMFVFLISLFDREHVPEKIVHLVWSKAGVNELCDEPATSWWKDYRVTAVALLGMTALFIIVTW